jgi:biotin transport system substrate-specific component
LPNAEILAKEGVFFMAIAPGTTLVDHIVPSQTSRSSNLVKDGVLIIGFSLFIALCAQISISLVPFTPIPITMQTLAALLTGAVLGSKRGALAMLLYLAEGATGLPVFQGLSGGMASLLGVDIGYFMAMPISAFVVGFLCEHGLDRSYRTSLLAMLPGTLIFYALGVTGLAFTLHVGIYTAVLEGMIPFIPGDLLKLVAAAALIPFAWQIVRKLKPESTREY